MGGVLNEFLPVAHETDGTVKPEAVQFAVTTDLSAPPSGRTFWSFSQVLE